MKVKEGEQAFVRAKVEIMQQKLDQIEEQNRYIIRLLSQTKNDKFPFSSVYVCLSFMGFYCF